MEFHKFDGGDLGLVCFPKETDPQHYAMLAAWFSRSTLTVDEMATKVTAEGAGKCMESINVGYGHESIGDLVDVKMFIHGVPLFLAPLLEHFALFRGQESSTRYIDFSQQRLYGADQKLMRAQIDEYLRALNFITTSLMDRHQPGTPAQERAIKARAFDICRCLIPLGAVTNVAWFGDIRSMKGHLAWMLRDHPWSTPWVEHIYAALKVMYPASMERQLYNIRPREPWVFDADDGPIHFTGTIDFGSWRDMNRHRVGRHTYPIINRAASFDPWYDEMFKLFAFQRDESLMYRALTRGTDQGSLLLGQRVAFNYEMPESQAQYFVHRRRQVDVHPTLRLKVQSFGLRQGILDESSIEPDVGLGYIERRGAQTILHQVA